MGVGSAAVDFQVGTGRMPAPAAGRAGARRRRSIYSQAEIDQLAAYVASLGAGPVKPDQERSTTPSGADIAKGGELFRTNCAQCHNFTGKGGALTHGKYAPGPRGRRPEARLRGHADRPAEHAVLPGHHAAGAEQEGHHRVPEAVNSDDTENPGGLKLGGLGPVSEGLFAWIFGLGALIAVAIWVAARTAKAKKS